MMEQFHWTSPAGVEIVMPRMSKIKTSLLRKYRKQEEMDMIFSIFEEMLDAETLAKVDELDQDELTDFIKKWQADVSVGESSGSSI